MAELYRHTDEDGDRLKILALADDGELGPLGVLIGRDDRFGPTVQAGVCLPEGAGRRLLAALLSYYGPRSEEISEEKDDHA